MTLKKHIVCRGRHAHADGGGGAGAKYVTITSRHHDGFSLWPTKVDDGYNIALTPFERDLSGEGTAFSKDQPLTRDRPVEQCDVLRHGVWGYRIGEKSFRTPVTLVSLVDNVEQ